MLTDKHEEFPHQSLRCYWPQEFFQKRRRFSRQAENQTYIEWLLASYEDGGDGDEDDEDDDDDNIEDGVDHPIEDDEACWHGDQSESMDKNRRDNNGAGAFNGHSTVRLFMTGMTGDEDGLQFRDQVEQVAGFCEQAGFKRIEKKVALLDDRNDGGTILMRPGHCRPYKGPLTSRQLREELSKNRFRVESDQNVPTNAFSDEGSDADRRVIFITDLDASAVEALAATAPRTQAPALKDLFYKHLTSKTFIGVTIPSQGFRVFTLSFHIPYYALRESKELLKDTRKRVDGKPLRKSWDLPFLSGCRNVSTFTENLYCLYETQISVSVTGIDHWVWTAYCFVDTYLGSKESVDGYHKLKARTGRPDPLAAGQIAANNPIWTPREYFFKVLEIRINEVRREWHVIIDKVEHEVKQSRINHVFPLLSNDPKTRQEVRNFSIWSTQMVRLIRQLISGLSDAVGAWDKFQRKEIGYFLYDGEYGTASSPLKSSVNAVDNAFFDLKDLLRKLQDLERELCKDNPQGLNAYLSFENHEAAIFQRKTAGYLEVLTVIILVFFPLALSATIFSTQGVLPFTPNLARFAYVLLVLAVLVVVTLVVLFNWDSWFQRIVEYITAEFDFRKATIRRRRKTDLPKLWDLESGPERVFVGSPKFENTLKNSGLPSASPSVSLPDSRYWLGEKDGLSKSPGQPLVIHAPARYFSERQDEGFVDTSERPFLKASEKPSFYVDKIREAFKGLRLGQNPPASTTVWISYQVLWDLPVYLDELFDPQQKLSEVLTLTAGLSDEFSDGFATSVDDYMERTWKRRGVLLLGAIETWLSNERKGETAQVNSDVEIRIKDGIGVGISQYDRAGKTTNTVIRIKASEEDHVDFATALSWLCASLRFSPNKALSSSGVNISKTPLSGDKIIEVVIRPTSLVLTGEIGGCWNILFTHSVIAKGFHIPTREEGKGLEISFPTMAKLAAILRLVEYDQGLVGEGLNTLLVPIKLLNKDQAIQWHIEEKLTPPQVEGEYQDRSVTSILNSHGSWYRELLPEALTSERAFLGWTHGAKVTIGTSDGPTDVKDSGTSSAQKGGLYITSYNATVGSSGLGFGGLGLGVAAVPARGQPYCMRNNPSILGYKLKNAAENQVVLYDAGEKIAWQVPQSCLMLQMIHAAIRHWDLKVDSSQESMEYANYEESHKLGGHNGLAALNAIYASRDLKFSMGSHDKDTCNDMLERLCLTLERVTEFHAEQKSKPEKGSKKAPKWIRGIELIDVIQEQNIWRVKESRVRQPWAHLADDTCPIFFCKNLGQAIVPTDFRGLCRAFQRVPAGNEYFVTSGLALCHMLGRHEHNNRAQLSEKVRWQMLNPMIQLHSEGGNHSCTHTHQLLCKSPFQFRGLLKPTRSKVEPYSGGAFIFHGSPGVACEEPMLTVDSPSKLETNRLSESSGLTTTDTASEKKDKGKEIVEGNLDQFIGDPQGKIGECEV